MNTSEVTKLIALIEMFASGRDDLRAAAICGSWARGNPRPDSDLDVLIIAGDPGRLRSDHEWIRELRFADAGFRYVDHEIATYGAVWAAHIRLEPQAELEVTVANATWAAVDPIDPGTRQVVIDAFKIIVDKDGILRRMRNACL